MIRVLLSQPFNNLPNNHQASVFKYEGVILSFTLLPETSLQLYYFSLAFTYHQLSGHEQLSESSFLFSPPLSILLPIRFSNDREPHKRGTPFLSPLLFPLSLPPNSHRYSAIVGPTNEGASKFLKSGACDFLCAPICQDLLRVRIAAILENLQLKVREDDRGGARGGRRGKKGHLEEEEARERGNNSPFLQETIKAQMRNHMHYPAVDEAVKDTCENDVLVEELQYVSSSILLALVSIILFITS
jgi:hypothetical protein